MGKKPGGGKQTFVVGKRTTDGIIEFLTSKLNKNIAFFYKICRIFEIVNNSNTMEYLTTNHLLLSFQFRFLFCRFWWFGSGFLVFCFFRGGILTKQEIYNHRHFSDFQHPILEVLKRVRGKKRPCLTGIN